MSYVSCLLAALVLCQAVPPATPARRAAQAHLKRADLLLSRNRIDEALRAYDQTIATDPEWPAAYVKRGEARRAKGDLEGSIEDYEKAGGLDPRSTANSRAVSESYNHRGMNRFDRLEIEGAVADFTKAIEHYGSEPNYFFRRGHARLIGEELAKAVGDFDRAIALNKGQVFLTALIRLHRGYALLLQGREAEARKEFELCKAVKGFTEEQLQLYLLGIEVRMREHRRRRAEALKRVA